MLLKIKDNSVPCGDGEVILVDGASESHDLAERHGCLCIAVCNGSVVAAKRN